MPRLEEWLLETCRRMGVDVQSLGLPTDPAQLHDELRTSPLKLRRLVEAIHGAPRILILKRELEDP